jgi:hypothetical protein
VHKTVKEDLEETGETDWTYRFWLRR